MAKKESMKDILKRLNAKVDKETQQALRGGMRTILGKTKKKRSK